MLFILQCRISYADSDIVDEDISPILASTFKEPESVAKGAEDQDKATMRWKYNFTLDSERNHPMKVYLDFRLIRIFIS